MLKFFDMVMVIDISSDVKNFTLSRTLSDLERELLLYFFNLADTASSTQFSVKITDTIPLFCKSIGQLQEILVGLIQLQINYAHGDDFGFFAIIESALIKNDLCHVVLGQNSLALMEVRQAIGVSDLISSS